MPVGNAREKVAQVLEKIQKAFDVFMPRRMVLKKRIPNFWWNAEIEALHKVCLKARRHSQRSRNRPKYEELHNRYNKARKELQVAIFRSKTEHFKSLCKEAGFDQWGGAYKAVMASIKGKRSPPITNPDLLRDIISTLFLEVEKKIAGNKVPGLDGIPNKALTVAVETVPRWFTEIFTRCLIDGIFPEYGRKQKLVLIPKPNKSLSDPSSYGPI